MTIVCRKQHNKHGYCQWPVATHSLMLSLSYCQQITRLEQVLACLRKLCLHARLVVTEQDNGTLAIGSPSIFDLTESCAELFRCLGSTVGDETEARTGFLVFHGKMDSDSASRLLEQIRWVRPLSEMTLEEIFKRAVDIHASSQTIIGAITQQFREQGQFKFSSENFAACCKEVNQLLQPRVTRTR